MPWPRALSFGLAKSPQRSGLDFSTAGTLYEMATAIHQTHRSLPPFSIFHFPIWTCWGRKGYKSEFYLESADVRSGSREWTEVFGPNRCRGKVHDGSWYFWFRHVGDRYDMTWHDMIRTMPWVRAPPRCAKVLMASSDDFFCCLCGDHVCSHLRRGGVGHESKSPYEHSCIATHFAPTKCSSGSQL